MIEWDDDRKRLLRTMWDEGLIAREIAKILGVSRSAILGMARRMKLPSRKEFARSAPTPKPKLAPKLKSKPQPVQEYVRTAPLLDLTDLDRHACKFPVEETSLNVYSFCGEPRDGKRPYCEMHAKLAYVPTKPRNMSKV